MVIIRRRYWLACLGMLVAAACFGLWLKINRKPQSLTASAVIPHAYESRDSIQKIRVKVFYAVPQNQAKEISKNWRGELEPVLKEAADFHRVQFHSTSELSFDVYPEPVRLERDSLYYDTVDTNYGNPEGLKRIGPELTLRFPEFLRASGEELLVTAVIYEGVGASGARGSMILSRTFLADRQYTSVRSALFYHELAHAYGLPDGYDTESGRVFSDDVMGRGRFRPLATGYIDPKTIKTLGVSGENH